MSGKTIKQIADELRVSKQAIWQRVKRREELSAMLQDHSETINGTIHVDAVLEQRIKEQYPERTASAVVDETGVNIPSTVDGTPPHVDETGVNIPSTVDGTPPHVDETGVNIPSTVDVDVNTLITTLQNTVDMLQQQLTVKDKQINELTAMLKASQEQQTTLVTALSAAQALHAGTLQERLTDQTGASGEPQRKAAVVENVPFADAPAPEPEPTEEQPKLKWWQRLIRRS